MASPRREIEQRLSSLAPRVRALRVASGVSRLVVAAVAGVAAVALFDAWLVLPAWARGLCLSVWLTGSGVLAWRWVVVPWRAEISAEDVASELEKRLPELGARLRDAVSGGHSDPPSAVRAAVAEDTARRARAADLARAIPLKPAVQLAGVAVAAALAFASAASYPGGGERLRRVALPWAQPNGRGDYRIHVATGELTVRRGGPVTLSAYAAAEPGKPAPTEAVLCRRAGPGAPEDREPMVFDGTTFHFTVPDAASDFEYCVEVGGTRSDWFRVTAIDAVELADGTRVEVRPPAYSERPARAAPGFADIDALQFSTAEFRLKFKRPAALAQLVWRPDGGPSEVLPLAVAADRLSATAAFALRQNGTLRLLLDSEAHGKRLRTEAPAAVRVAPDSPPQFERISGLSARPRTARPGDVLRVEFAARDDIALSGAVLEYVVGSDESKPAAVPVPFGEPRRDGYASGAIDFPLAGAEGQTFRVRLRVRDNRTVDDPKLGPQEAVYPPAGWSEVRLSAAAPPLAEQNVACQSGALRDGLSAAVKDVGGAAGEVDALRRDTAGRGALAFDQAARLNNLRDKLGTTSAALGELAKDASLTPELRPLAAGASDVAGQALAPAAELLRKAETDEPAARKAALDAASARLAEAGTRLNELSARNDRFGQERLDRLRLSALAADQAALADRAKGGDLLPQERELLARLEAVVAASEPLKAAVASAKGAEVRRLAGEARRFADALRQLDANAKRAAGGARAELVAVIAREQDSLAKRTADLFAKLGTPCRLAGVALPRPEDFLRVAELAAAGKTVEALTELEKHAQALERIAAAFDKWAAERADAKFAAKQLALWQDDLLARFAAATKAGGFAALPPVGRAEFRDEQKALAAALAALDLPPDAAVKAARDGAADHARVALAALASNGAGAETAMALVATSLHLLADRTPTVGERLAKSQRALDALRVELAASGDAIDAALRGFESRPPDATTAAALARKLAPFAERQRKLVAGAAALDLPGLEARRERLIAALSAAAGDARDGSPLDAAASQAWVRREFERLKWSIEGNPSPDATAAELHHKLADLADALDRRGPGLTRKEVEPAAPVLQEAARRLSATSAPEAAALLNEARVAVHVAEAGLRDPRPDEARRRIRAAADALARLADRLIGAEPDLQRVQRLALSRHRAAGRPKEPLFSDEAVRQLGREADELTATRTGPGGQLLKKRALDLYARLRTKSDPDRMGSDLKALATTLDELAAKMADVPELATVAPPPAPGAPPVADGFLPSRALADAIRALATQQRALHAQVTGLAAELAARLRPSLLTAEGRAALFRWARADELVRSADEFASQLSVAASTLGPGDATAQSLTESAKEARDARRRMAEAAKKAAEGDAAEADKLRAAAEALLRAATERLEAVAPPGSAPPSGESLRAAERAMRKAIQHLAPGGDPAAAERAMRDTAEALRDAERAIGK